jgi:hypothetical protein
MRTVYFLKILYYNTVFNIGETLFGLKKINSLEIKKNIKGFLITVRSISNPVLSSSFHDISGEKNYDFRLSETNEQTRRNPENSGVISVENWCALPGLMGPDICAG